MYYLIELIVEQLNRMWATEIAVTIAIRVIILEGLKLVASSELQAHATTAQY